MKKERKCCIIGGSLLDYRVRQIVITICCFNYFYYLYFSFIRQCTDNIWYLLTINTLYGNGYDGMKHVCNYKFQFCYKLKKCIKIISSPTHNFFFITATKHRKSSSAGAHIRFTTIWTHFSNVHAQVQGIGKSFVIKNLKLVTNKQF